MRDQTREQIEDAYRTMAREARYRPMAPSDGFGNITVPPDELDLDAEAQTYAERWWGEEEKHDFHVGVPDFTTRKALIYTVEAARLLCQGRADSEAADHARKLLELAAAEVTAD